MMQELETEAPQDICAREEIATGTVPNEIDTELKKISISELRSARIVEVEPFQSGM
jgi:hypothetical protein